MIHRRAFLCSVPLAVAMPVAADADQNSEIAQATFEMGFSTQGSTGRSMTQQYRLGATDEVGDSKSVKIFSWGSKRPKTVTLVVDRPVFVFAQLSRLHGAPGIAPSGKNWCIDVARFTPRAGGRYRITQTGAPDGPCPLTITDESDGNRT